MGNRIVTHHIPRDIRERSGAYGQEPVDPCGAGVRDAVGTLHPFGL